MAREGVREKEECVHVHVCVQEYLYYIPDVYSLACMDSVGVGGYELMCA